MTLQISDLKFFWLMTWGLAKRELIASLRSPGIYLAAAIAVFFEAQSLSVSLDFLQDYRLLVAQDLVLPAFLGAVVIAGLYAAVAAAASIVQERERKTLRVLFYTPLDYSSLIAGKYLAQMLGACLILLAAAVYSIAASAYTSFRLDASLLGAALLSVLLLSSMVAFGLALSALAHSTRAAVLLLLVILALLFAAQLAPRVIAGLLPLQNSSLLVYTLPLANLLSAVAAWLSPLAYLLKGMEAAALTSTSDYLLVVLASLAYSAVFMMLTLWFLKRRGVLA